MVLSEHGPIRMEEPLLDKDSMDPGQATRNCRGGLCGGPQWTLNVQNGARSLLVDPGGKPSLEAIKTEGLLHGLNE